MNTYFNKKVRSLTKRMIYHVYNARRNRDKSSIAWCIKTTKGDWFNKYSEHLKVSSDLFEDLEEVIEEAKWNGW